MSRIFLSFLTLTATMTCGTLCGQTLGEVVAESNADWLIGEWAEFENASTNVAFKWLLDKHVIVVSFESDSTKMHGLITFRVSENKVLYVAADNRGATGSGEWLLTDKHPTLFYKQISDSGKETSAGFVHKKIDDKTMVIAIYELNKGGKLSGEPLASPKFVRR